MELTIDLTKKAQGYKDAFLELVTSPHAEQGNMRCEFGSIPYHDLTKKQLANRARVIDHKRVCAKFTNFHIDGDVIKITVVPFGPMKGELETLLATGVEFQPVARARYQKKEIVHMDNIDLVPIYGV